MKKYLQKTFLIFLLLFNTLTANTVFAEVFRFHFVDGEVQKISSVVSEDVYFNGIFSHTSEIVNRIVAKVIQTKEENNGQRSSALYSCTFMTSEKADDGHFNWGREYPTMFWRDDMGKYSIGQQYFMPVVRNVPIFPENDIQIGETWNAQGEEAYDFSSVFGIEKPVITPLNISYKYDRVEKIDGVQLHIILAEYEKEYTVPESFIRQYMKNGGRGVWPSKTTVKSKQKIAWNAKKGSIAFYDEKFSIRLLLNNGVTVDYKGSSHAKVTEIIRNEDERNKDKIKKNIEQLELENTKVEKCEKGLKIIIENIQFEVNSAILRESEKEKIKAIAQVLKENGKGDILIEGHTVFSGTFERRKELSEKRAKAVADYLIELKVRDASHIFTRGLGGDFPLFPNTTEENKAKNRRVEITIME